MIIEKVKRIQLEEEEKVILRRAASILEDLMDEVNSLDFSITINELEDVSYSEGWVSED